MLLASARPIRIEVEEDESIPKNFTISHPIFPTRFVICARYLGNGLSTLSSLDVVWFIVLPNVTVSTLSTVDVE